MRRVGRAVRLVAQQPHGPARRDQRADEMAKL